MMTFSTSPGTGASLPISGVTTGVTSLCIVPASAAALRPRARDSGRPPAALTLPLFPPPGDGTPQLEARDRAGDRRQPERDRAIRQHRDDRQAAVDAEADERADHAAVDAADTARKRQQVAEHADEVTHHDDRPRRRLAERAERRPQDRDVEGPVGDGPEDRRV